MTAEATQLHTVLVIDDQPDHLELTSRVLKAHALQVVTARNGVEGMTVLQSTQPSAIVLDLSMPQMDGWEMMRRVRANPQTQAVPMIAVTAYLREEDRSNAIAAGFDACLLKPVPAKTLITTLKGLLPQPANEQ
jgi:CheY-like chemotaxis protein